MVGSLVGGEKVVVLKGKVVCKDNVFVKKVYVYIFIQIILINVINE